LNKVGGLLSMIPFLNYKGIISSDGYICLGSKGLKILILKKLFLIGEELKLYIE